MHLTERLRDRDVAAWLCRGIVESAAFWADVNWLLGTSRLPVLLKRVLHPDDARQAAKLWASPG